MAEFYEFGYPVERFETIVSRRFHCAICLNVFKDPVMCHRNQHPFCRVCITRHLMNFQKCPVCMDHLTVDTLTDPPRILTDYLSELKIRCDFHPRGCQQYVKLDDLERHVNDCGFAPVVCSNEGCLAVVDRREVAYHQTTTCKERVAKCHKCEQLTKEVVELRMNLTATNDKLDSMESTLATAVTYLGSLATFATNFDTFKADLRADIGNKLDGFASDVNRLEAIEYKLEEHNQQMKARFTAVSEPLAKLSRLENDKQCRFTLQEASDCKKTSETSNVIVAGGLNKGKKLASVEKFNLSTKTWTIENAMQSSICEASSILHHNQMIIFGGKSDSGVSDDVVRRNIGIKSADWKPLEFFLPTKLRGHCSVVYDNHLYVIGGCYENGTLSTEIYAIQLIPPYRFRVVTRLPEEMPHHSVQIFDDKIVIVGGVQSSWSYRSRVCNVFLYDISKNVWRRLASVPSAGLREMATVRWGDHVIIMGGVNARNQPMKTVVMYNIKTELSDMLPDMNYSRRGSVGAVLGNSILAIGGATHGLDCLNTVECFDFKRFSWQELSPMNDARYLATGLAF
jgi:N-acetylneuraminic acid mutarotase